MSEWGKCYSKKFGGTWYPNEEVVRFSARYLKRKVGINIFEEKKKVVKILDAGCGNGRHVIFLAEQGFNVYGFDISKEAVKIANSWLRKKRLKAHLQVWDIRKKLPFNDKNFNVVIACETLDHILFEDAKKAIKELERVLAPGGYLFISLRSTESSECGRGKKVATHTFLLKEGYEKGLIQHFFNLKEIKELLKGLKIFDAELQERKFPDVYTVDKYFLQSSRGFKKYLSLDKDFNLKDSRWYIAAEKI